MSRGVLERALHSPPAHLRFERSHAEEFPDVWRSLCAELGDEQLARQAVVLGSVLAALDERVPLHPEVLALIELGLALCAAFLLGWHHALGLTSRETV